MKTAAAPTRKQIFVSEEVLEVRYAPKGSFLSSIGNIADYVVDQKLFKHWKIENSNRIEFTDTSDGTGKFTAFMSYRNAGCISLDPDTRNYFKDKATQFLKTVFANKFFAIPDVLRIGVRTKCFVKSDLDFQEIESRMFRYFFNAGTLKDVGLKRKDLQVVLDYEGSDMSMRLTFGPLPKKQAFELFQLKSDHFESCGLFFDFDCFTDKPTKDHRSVEAFVRTATEKNWAQVDSVLLEMGF